MNNIRLTNYPLRGVKTEINGIEMQEVRDIQLTCPVDGVTTLRLEQNVGPDLDVTVNGHVQPILSFNEEQFELHVEHLTPTSTRYWVEVKK